MPLGVFPFARAPSTVRTLGFKRAAALFISASPSCLSRAVGARAGVPEMAWLGELFQRWHLPQAGVEASNEARQTDLHAPTVCVVPAREVEDAAQARSASGSSRDQAKTTGALQHSEAAKLADEIMQLSTAPAPRGAARSVSHAYC